MRIKIIFIFLLTLLSSISFAQTYPDTCPAEARGVLEAVGGCAVVNCNQYPAICDKCCVKTTPPSQIQPTQNLDRTTIIIVIIIAAAIIIWWLQHHKTKRK